MKRGMHVGIGLVIGFILGWLLCVIFLGRFEFGRYQGVIIQRVDRFTGKEVRYPEKVPDPLEKWRRK